MIETSLLFLFSNQNTEKFFERLQPGLYCTTNTVLRNAPLWHRTKKTRLNPNQMTLHDTTKQKNSIIPTIKKTKTGQKSFFQSVCTNSFTELYHQNSQHCINHYRQKKKTITLLRLNERIICYISINVLVIITSKNVRHSYFYCVDLWANSV